MPKYLFKASYTAEGARGLKRDGGSSRRAVLEEMAKSLGGSLESMYFAFGGSDLYTVADLPDNAAAAAISLSVAVGGGATAETVVLLTPEEMDEAAKREVSYRPPGK